MEEAGNELGAVDAADYTIDDIIRDWTNLNPADLNDEEVKQLTKAFAAGGGSFTNEEE